MKINKIAVMFVCVMVIFSLLTGCSPNSDIGLKVNNIIACDGTEHANVVKNNVEKTICVASCSASLKHKRATVLKRLKAHKITKLEKEVFNLVNEERAKAGLEKLKWSKKLFALSNIRSKEIKKKWSHVRPNGKKFSDVFYQYNAVGRSTVCGENILKCSSSLTAKQIVAAWMNSPPHRGAILKKKYKYTGLHIYSCKSGIYSSELFTNK